MKNIQYILYSLAFLIFNQCTEPKTITQTNIAEDYLNDAGDIDAQFVFHHLSPDSSSIHYQIKTDQILFSRADMNSPYFGSAIVEYTINTAAEPITFVDTGKIELTFAQQDIINNTIHGSFNIALDSGYYQVYLKVADGKRPKAKGQYFLIDKTSPYSNANFLLHSTDSSILFNNWVEPGDTVYTVNYRMPNFRYKVKYYQRDFDLALPPFFSYSRKAFNYSPDSVFTLSSDGEFFEFSPKKKGFYLFSTSAKNREGFTILSFPEPFPQIKTIDQLTEPLRYITSKKEFNTLMASDDIKKAVDDFWLNCTKNPNRARELVRTYYTRVEEANRLFTSFKEGWTTDRGMLYIVLGPPDVVYRSAYAETWTYGEEGGYTSNTFDFIRVKNPFSPNDFELNRSPLHKNFWYRAVDTWRQWRVTMIAY